VNDGFGLDTELGEELHEHEIEAAGEIAALLSRQVRRQCAADGPPARRDAHPKAHGLLAATFTVEENLPAELAQGVFVPGSTYPAWIRFSNADADVSRSDAKGDGRGMAIKLFNVPGPKIMAHDRDAATQDFMLLNSPVFILNDPRRYLKVLRRNASRNPLLKLLGVATLGLKGALLAMKLRRARISSPLTTRYWSAVPYRLGDAPHKLAVKFSAVPREPVHLKPATTDPNFLRRAMVEHLAERDAFFDFLVQPRTSAAMSVEDARTEWREREAPFHKVATIRIPQQTFATAARDALAENLSFSPWHALPQHRPLGSVNRTRRVVYSAIAGLRRELNGAPMREPAEWVEPSA